MDSSCMMHGDDVVPTSLLTTPATTTFFRTMLLQYSSPARSCFNFSRVKGKEKKNPNAAFMFCGSQNKLTDQFSHAGDVHTLISITYLLCLTSFFLVLLVFNSFQQELMSFSYEVH